MRSSSGNGGVVVGRVKFQVWSPSKQAWRTAYCKPELVERNTHAFNDAGFIVHVNSSEALRYLEKRA